LSRFHFGRGGGKRLDCHLQTRQLVDDHIPKNAIGRCLILVPQHVPDVPDFSPGDFRSGIGDRVWNGTAGFRDDLDSALNRSPHLPTCLEIVQRFAAGYFFHPRNRLEDVVENVVKLSRHQKIRIAERSMSALSMG
jgi:hypothetical protein